MDAAQASRGRPAAFALIGLVFCKAEVYGLGPTALWAAEVGQQSVTLIATWLHELNGDSRVEGDHFTASFVVDW